MRDGVIAGVTDCGAIILFAPPFLCTAPITTGVATPFTGTIPKIGEGGSPPPMKVSDLSPPQEPVTLTAPDPLNRFTQYPLASPNSVVQLPAAGDIGRLVLKATNPEAMTAEVTVCSPVPY